MAAPSHQTVPLGKGRHESPEEGACVMELASLLAGEPFTDHPHSVCPVIAMVMRGYNDGIDDARRQDLLGYASAAVGTRAGRAERQQRIRLCREFFGLPARRLETPGRRLRAIGRAAIAHAVTATPESHAAMLDLLDRLLGGRPEHADTVAASPAVPSG